MRTAFALAADRRMALPLAVTLASLAKHLSESAIAVVATPEPIEHSPWLKRLNRCLDRLQVRYFPLAIDASLERVRHLPAISYARLTLAEWLPNDLERVVWLDADLLVRTDAADLLHETASLDTVEPVAAVQDVRIRRLGDPEGLEYAIEDEELKTLQLDADRDALDLRYVNAGVLGINLEVWRRHDFGRRLVDFARRNAGRLCWGDQDCLNAVFAGRIRQLDWRWNVPVPALAGPNALPVAELDPYRSVMLDGQAIYHFVGAHKPWLGGVSHTHRAAYDRAVADLGLLPKWLAEPFARTSWVRALGRSARSILRPTRRR